MCRLLFGNTIILTILVLLMFEHGKTLYPPVSSLFLSLVVRGYTMSQSSQRHTRTMTSDLHACHPNRPQNAELSSESSEENKTFHLYILNIFEFLGKTNFTHS